MTTEKAEADRFNYLKTKVDGSEILSPDESKEWKEKWNWLVAAYYVDQETLDAVEGAAANFIQRVEEGRNGNMDVWPVEEIDGSESTSKALALVNPRPVPESVVTFDSADEYGIDDSGKVFVDAKGIEVCRLVEQRLEYDSLMKQLESNRKEIDNRLALMMKDKEKFVVPGCSVTYKILAGRETASAKAIRAYYEARGERIPDGFISKSEDSRSIRFYPSRKRGK